MQRTLIAGLATAALVSSGFGLAAGTAQADNAGPYQWCPGQDMVFSPQTGSTGPGRDKIWDMNVCHTWYFVDYGKGNVPSKCPPPSPMFRTEIIRHRAIGAIRGACKRE
jgi:hypothetical protein